MKNLTLSVLLMLIVSVVVAQPKKAEAILKEVADKTQSYRSIKIKFTYVMENRKADIYEEVKGELLVKKEKYKLSISGQEVINDGETIWTYITDANEVQINSVEEEDQDLASPMKLLTSYDERFKPKYLEERVWMGHKVHAIELKPKEDKSYKHVTILTDIEKKRVMQISVYDKSDNTFTYSVTEFKPNVLFEYDVFTFNEADYPDVEVIDMR